MGKKDPGEEIVTTDTKLESTCGVGTLDPPDSRDDLRPKSALREYVETIIICVMLLAFARSFVFIQSKIPTGSMIGTILIGDYILVNRFIFAAPGDEDSLLPGQRKIERGDIIVFRYPRDPDVDYVKRVVGLPGETVRIDHGRVLIDGVPLDESYVREESFDPRSFRAQEVPLDHYLVLGDNRRYSEDSRFWGFVPRSMIKGRAFFIWYSYDEDRDDYLKTGWKRLVSVARKIPRLPFKTRWGRLFQRIR